MSQSEVGESELRTNAAKKSASRCTFRDDIALRVDVITEAQGGYRRRASELRADACRGPEIGPAGPAARKRVRDAMEVATETHDELADAVAVAVVFVHDETVGSDPDNWTAAIAAFERFHEASDELVRLIAAGSHTSIRERSRGHPPSPPIRGNG